MIYFTTMNMKSNFKKNQSLDFSKSEKTHKTNIDYFHLKEDRAKERKQEKVHNFLFVSAAAAFVIAFVAIIY